MEKSTKPKKNINKNVKPQNKQVRLSPCDIAILKTLRNGSVEVLKIHDKLSNYSDQEVSLNLSWLEKKGYVKKVLFSHPSGFKSVSFQLDNLGKDFLYRH